MCVFGDFKVHHKDWLTYSSGTDRPDELCYNFSFSSDLINFSTRILDSDSHRPALLDLFIYLFIASIYSALAFPTMGVSVSSGFPSYSQQDVPLLYSYNYYRANWDGIRGQLRDAPWEDICKLRASSEFCKWVQVGIDVYILHQVKSHGSTWFSVACAADIVHRNHFFRLYQKDKSSHSKVKFIQASNRCKRVLEAV